MFGLPRKQEQQTSKNTLKQANAPRRQHVRYTLVPTVVGSMMIMMPRRESDGGPEWPDRIPPIE